MLGAGLLLLGYGDSEAALRGVSGTWNTGGMFNEYGTVVLPFAAWMFALWLGAVRYEGEKPGSAARAICAEESLPKRGAPVC
jgi:hypothetical protein